ncbi:hypothetical protein SAMN05216194_102461 [Stutzerimonas kunmingensis]|nr:hypothetical protein SAMN05216194_102461 [Stutzerimonas kunmingensis]
MSWNSTARMGKCCPGGWKEEIQTVSAVADAMAAVGVRRRAW